MDENFSANSNNLDDGSGHVPFPRWVVVCVVVLLLSIAGLSVWQMRNRFIVTLPKLGTGESVQSIATSLLEAQDEQLKQQDSDQDGLNDYQELKVYGSSPFIADTDSDGVTDAAEVRLGTDPVCPTGKTCRGNSQTLVDTASNTNPFLSSEFALVLEDPAKIRQLLIQGGADPLVINQLDDQTLQVLGQEALKAATEPTQEKFDILSNVTIDQVRGFLKASGLTDQQLAEFTDEQIMELYNQALAQVQSESAKTSP